jgi:hypothetical protein
VIEAISAMRTTENNISTIGFRCGYDWASKKRPAETGRPVH